MRKIILLIVLTVSVLASASTNYVVGSLHVAQNLKGANVASFSSITAVSIAATGWTNVWSTNNANVRVTGGGQTITVKNSAHTTVDTLATFTGTVVIPIQPGWGISAASGLSGKAWPF